jgi:peptidoglycan-N-acetylmuramic acid deacetylase
MKKDFAVLALALVFCLVPRSEVRASGVIKKGSTALTTEAAQTDGTASAQSTNGTAAEKASPVIVPKWIKSDADVLNDLSAVPDGPAVTEWGNYYPIPGEAPIGNETEEYLRERSAYSRVSTEEKDLYLTFDLGYENGYTETILETLKKHKVRAAFFVTGAYVKERPDLVKEIAEEGHIVGNHTRSHPDMGKVTTKEAFYNQLIPVEQLYTTATGYPMNRFYRPPSGKYSDAHFRMAQAMGYRTILWSVAYYDWDNAHQPSHEKALGFLTGHVHPGAIVLMHGTSKTNSEILDEQLTRWEAMGYRFKTLNELPDTL